MKKTASDWSFFLNKFRRLQKNIQPSVGQLMLPQTDAFLNKVSFQESSAQGKINLYRTGNGKITDD